MLTVADDASGDDATIAGGFTLTIALTDEVAPVTTITKKLKKLSTGKHTFQVRATDAAKNVGAPVTVSWKVKPKG